METSSTDSVLKLLAVIESETGRSVTLATPLSSLDLDSLEFVDLLLQVEKAFNSKIPDELVPKLDTVGDLAEYLNRDQIPA